MSKARVWSERPGKSHLETRKAMLEAMERHRDREAARKAEKHAVEVAHTVAAEGSSEKRG